MHHTNMILSERSHLQRVHTDDVNIYWYKTGKLIYSGESQKWLFSCAWVMTMRGHKAGY